MEGLLSTGPIPSKYNIEITFFSYKPFIFGCFIVKFQFSTVFKIKGKVHFCECNYIREKRRGPREGRRKQGTDGIFKTRIIILTCANEN